MTKSLISYDSQPLDNFECKEQAASEFDRYFYIAALCQSQAPAKGLITRIFCKKGNKISNDFYKNSIRQGNRPLEPKAVEVEFFQWKRFYMRKSKFTDSQIMDAVKRVDAGFGVPDICREMGISTATFYKWRAKYGGMDVSMMSRMKELEEENRRLKKMYLEEKLKAEIVSEALEKKW